MSGHCNKCGHDACCCPEMSGSPRTDAVAAHEGNYDTKALRMTHHARQLERELSDMTAARDSWANRWADLSRTSVNDVVRLERELAEARGSIGEMRDLIVGMNFGDGFPAITRAVENANNILEETK